MFGGGGGISFCLLSSFLLLDTRYVNYLMAIWWVVFIVSLLVMWGYVGSQGILSFLCEWLPFHLR